MEPPVMSVGERGIDLDLPESAICTAPVIAAAASFEARFQVTCRFPFSSVTASPSFGVLNALGNETACVCAATAFETGSGVAAALSARHAKVVPSAPTMTITTNRMNLPIWIFWDEGDGGRDAGSCWDA